MGGHGSRLWSRDAETVTKGTWAEGLDWLPFQFIESRTQGEIPRQGEEKRTQVTQMQKPIKSKEAQRDKVDAMCHQNPRF